MTVAESSRTREVEISRDNVPLQSRPLLLAERTMYRDGKTPFTCVFTIKLSGRIEEKKLYKALGRIQAKHPLLRSVVQHKNGTPHFIVQEFPAPIPVKVVERLGEDDWQFEVHREWVTPFPTEGEPLARMVWLQGKETHELMLVAHHCICDGQSGVTLLRELLSVYDHPEQDIGFPSKLIPVDGLVPAELRENRQFQKTVRRKAFLFRLGLALKRVLSRRPAAPQVAPLQMYFHRWHVDRIATLALTERCRTEGVTVLAATSLALMQAFRDVCGVTSLKNAYTMVNARRFLPQLPQDSMFGVVPGVALRRKDLPNPGEMATSGFWDRARAIKADMAKRIDRLGSGLYSYLVALESMHGIYSRLVSDTESAPVVRHVTLSNMGRIDLPQQYQNFRVEAVYSPLVMVSPTPANTVVLSSFAGEMEIAIISDVQSLPYTKAAAIHRRLMEILTTCVALPEVHETAQDKKPSAVQAGAL